MPGGSGVLWGCVRGWRHPEGMGRNVPGFVRDWRRLEAMERPPGIVGEWRRPGHVGGRRVL